MNRLGESFALEELRASLQAEQFRSAGRNGAGRSGRRPGDLDAGPVQLRSSVRARSSSFPSASSSRPRPRNATASRTPGSSASRTTMALTSTTRPSPPTTAGSSCRNWWRPPDFLRFRFITLNGPAAREQRHGAVSAEDRRPYAMLSRQDNENIYLMFSDNVHFWNERKLLLKPAFPWELVQMGTADRPSRPMPVGWSSATVWARCDSTASARSCSISTILRK